MQKFVSFISTIFRKFNLFPIFLALICLFILTTTYVPGTWLSGWDTLHPEFDFALNFKRLFFGVFRSEQGLGAVAAHAHMSDLPRVVFLFLSSFVLPLSFLRFFYIALCLPIGAFGVYFFTKNIIFSTLEKKQASGFAFLSALFYVFNLGTLQHFFVPFEMFTTAYAFIPWIFLTASNFINKSTKKNLLYFAVINLLASPMAYASLLWYVTYLSLGLYLLFFAKKHFKQVLALVVLSILVNSFWILPDLYFLFSGNAALVPTAKINEIFSDEAFLYNKSYGNIKDALLFRNFLLDWTAYAGNNHFEYLMDVWRNHLSNPFVVGLGYILSGLSLFGVTKLFINIKKRESNKFLTALIVPALISLVFIVNANQPFDFIFSYFRDHFQLFREAFRFPFTKFSIILMFCMSVFFGVGNYFLYTLIQKIEKLKKYLHLILPIQICTIALALFVYMFPIFQGNLISPKMFVKIPPEYFQTFDYLKTQNANSRVSFLPAQSFWGWVYYDFGFQGAQFVTFGITQPVMDRDWDRWNPDNEQYYREFSYAVYSQNSQLLQKVLDKYNVGFLIVDENIISPDSNSEQNNLYTEQISKLLKNSSYLTLDKKLNKISIYKYDKTNSLIEAKQSYTNLAEKQGISDIDFAYLNQGDYIQKPNNTSSVNYPLLTLLDNQNLLSGKVVDDENGETELKFTNLKSDLKAKLEDYLKSESVIPARVFTKIDGNSLNIKFSLILPKDSNSEDLSLEESIPLYLVNDLNLGVVLSVDKYNSLELKNLESQEYKDQGSILLSTGTLTNLKLSNPVDFIKTQTAIVDNIVLDPTVKTNFSFNLCNKPDKDQVFSFGVTNEGNIKIAAKNSTACLWVPLDKVLNSRDLGENSLVKFSFSTKSENDGIGRYCIFDKALDRCVKSQKYILNENEVNSYFTIESGKAENYELVLYVDGINNNKLDQIEYSNLNLAVAQPFYQFGVAPEDLMNIVSGKTINFTNNSSLNLNDLKNSVVEPFDLLETGHQKSECSNIDTKDYDRQINKQNGYIEYESTKGSSCDFFSFPSLDHNLGYLLVIDNKNLEGLPLRVCAANPFSKRCDVYLSLPYNKNFEKNVVLIPPIADSGLGYDIHFDNYSVGNIASVNQLKSLEIIPVPYYFLKNQFTQDAGSFVSSEITKTYSQEIFPGLIKVDFAKQGEGSGLITLNESYESGWWMVDAAHVKVNGWANGWLVNDKYGSRLVIYLPQILEFLGFGILISVFVWFVNLFRN